ncbi:hypothetical protein KEM60_02939 [Austwickia sp. TVS 96-490-7B]|uniref:hypothetical protein n=1 Tax=Austwickia sp. TVS 96-490-7B TaxID=2830843 RepID=UPI001C57B992|nr:hypothetical protein [Austwickia sp. TVS 96-490-7B]MBW3086710.1 hypothetical protein [Austwickia sp. TVS 96-490-7B]
MVASGGCGECPVTVGSRWGVGCVVGVESGYDAGRHDVSWSTGRSLRVLGGLVDIGNRRVQSADRPGGDTTILQRRWCCGTPVKYEVKVTVIGYAAS